MAAAVTYTFAPGANVESAKFNQNFTDLCNYINGNVVLKDGSVAFTGVPSGPTTDPTTDNQFARKAYVDGKVGLLAALVKNSVSNSTDTTSGGVDLGIDMPTWVMPTIANGRAVRIALTWPWSILVSQGGDFPSHAGAAASVFIRVNGTNQQRHKIPITSSALTPSDNHGGTAEWIIRGNTTYPAGTTMTLKVYGSRANPGAIQLGADASNSILYYAHII